MIYEGPQQGSTGVRFSVDLIDKATGDNLPVGSGDTATIRFKRPTEVGVQDVAGTIEDATATTPPRAVYVVPASSNLLSLLGIYGWQAHVQAGGIDYWSDPRWFRVGPNLA